MALLLSQARLIPQADQALKRGEWARSRFQGVELAGIYVCPHEEGVCDCRKPGVGLFRQAAHDHPWIRFADGHMVGDSISDAQAAAAIGMGRIWLVGEDVESAAEEAEEHGIEVAGTAPDLARLVRTELRLSTPG